jgi:nucleotide-binding universal stress UspA family protein
MDGRPIIVGYDGSAQSEVALRWALDEGVRRSAPIAIAHVVTPDVGQAGAHRGRGPGRSEQQARSAIERIAREAYDWGRLGIEVTGDVIDGPIASALCEQSRRACMVVVGARGLGGFAGLQIGSICLKVAAHAHCPVVVVRGDLQVPDRRPVAVGVDDSAQGRLAVGLAFEEAALRDVALVAMRGWGMPRLPWHSVDRRLAPPIEARSTVERHLVNEVVASWRERYPDVEVTTRLECVTAAHALTVASRDAQLMVIGSRGSGGFADLALGSVSQQLLHHSLCSMIVVRGLVEPPRPVVRAAARPAASVWPTNSTSVDVMTVARPESAN